MNPHSKPRPLFFTPRSPWGRLPLKHALKSHMRASEKQLKEIQKQQQQSQQQVQRYVNTAMSAVDEGAAILQQQQQGQRKPAR